MSELRKPFQKHPTKKTGTQCQEAACEQQLLVRNENLVQTKN